MIAYLLCSLVFSGLYYVQSYASGLTAKKWALAGLVLGPMLYPLFRSHQRVKLLKAIGRDSALLRV